MMGSRLEEAGWIWVDDQDQADLILVNTCAFIQSAQEESIDSALSFAGEYPRTPVVLTGCMAQRFPQELSEGMPEIAGIFGNRAPEQIDEFVSRLSSDATSPVVWLPEGDSALSGTPRHRFLSRRGSAFVKVAEGCDHNCSFCAIPSIRGRLRMRPSADIVAEARELRERGVFELNLVAQDLAAWREAGPTSPGGIVGLLRRMLEDPGEFWLRLLYLYPDTFPHELLELAASDSRLLPYFDLSFQHAAPHILRRMGRPGDDDTYLRLIERIRSVLPDVALRSSFIVGFPGETEKDVEILEDFLRAAQLEWVGVLTYSPQDGTPAAVMAKRDGAVPEPVAEERRQRLMVAQEQISTDRLSRFVGREVPVLIEEPFDGADLALGRCPVQAPEVDGLVVVHGGGELQPGDRVRALVTAVSGLDLQARIVKPRIPSPKSEP